MSRKMHIGSRLTRAPDLQSFAFIREASMNPAQPVNILLVDDHPQNLVALSAILEDPAYNLVTAASGPEALGILLKMDLAVILLDVMMPGMDGFEVASLIKQREKTRTIPIIFVTA